MANTRMIMEELKRLRAADHFNKLRDCEVFLRLKSGHEVSGIFISENQGAQSLKFQEGCWRLPVDCVLKFEPSRGVTQVDFADICTIRFAPKDPVT